MNDTAIYHPFSRMFREYSRADFCRVEVEEDDAQYRICADIPGADKNDVSVSLEDSILSIGAKTERRGEFKRAFRLPRQTDADGIAATVKNGVLTVVVPKAKADGRKIEVR